MSLVANDPTAPRTAKRSQYLMPPSFAPGGRSVALPKVPMASGVARTVQATTVVLASGVQIRPPLVPARSVPNRRATPPTTAVRPAPPMPSAANPIELVQAQRLKRAVPPVRAVPTLHPVHEVGVPTRHAGLAASSSTILWHYHHAGGVLPSRPSVALIHGRRVGLGVVQARRKKGASSPSTFRYRDFGNEGRLIPAVSPTYQAVDWAAGHDRAFDRRYERHLRRAIALLNAAEVKFGGSDDPRKYDARYWRTGRDSDGDEILILTAGAPAQAVQSMFDHLHL